MNTIGFVRWTNKLSGLSCTCWNKQLKSRWLHATSALQVTGFYQPFKKGSKKVYDICEARINELSELDKLQMGWKVLKDECKWGWEKIKFQADPTNTVEVYEDREIVKLWQFDLEQDRQNWRTAADSDYDEGFSNINYSTSSTGRALLTGHVDTKLPADGNIKRAGFVFFGSEILRKPFLLRDAYDWTSFNHFVIRCRGDGRTWTVVLNTSGSYDISWGDRHCYHLWTRGGPYWQTTMIPFSRFVFTSMQRAPDYQVVLDRNSVSQVALRLSDRMSGPFKLEIDYIGLMKDENFTEETSYEMYYTPEKHWIDLGEC